MSKSMELEVPTLVELDSREASGVKVDLLYQRTGNLVLVHIHDEQAGELQFPVPPENALDAFHHPFTYAPSSLEAA
jgi:hypothetical protein